MSAHGTRRKGERKSCADLNTRRPAGRSGEGGEPKKDRKHNPSTGRASLDYAHAYKKKQKKRKRA